jgi:hypothetical protein
MNVAGKSLQDIYDAGSKRLEELEKGQKSQLGDAADAHLQDLQEHEPTTLKDLETKSSDLEQEIRAHLSHGLERVEKAVSSESKHTQAYVERLVESISLLAKKFTESISQIRATADSQLTDLAQEEEQLYKSAVQGSLSELNKEAAVAVDDCRKDGSGSHADLITRLDESWSKVLEKEDQSVGELLDGYDANSDQLSLRVNVSRQEIQNQLSEMLSKLEMRALQATEAVKSAADRLVESADRFAFDSDSKLKENFSTNLQETQNAIEESASASLKEVVNLHESSMADLTMKSQDLSRGMDGLAENVTTEASGKSNQLQDKGKNLIGSYTDELATRLESGKVFQQELEKERSQMVSEIWRELSDVRSKFEDKLANLAKSTLDKMHSICDDAETAIVTAQHDCISSSKAHAGDRQSSIETSAADFIARIQQTRDAALEAIAKAAGAGSDDDDAPASKGDDDAAASKGDDDAAASKGDADDDGAASGSGSSSSSSSSSGSSNSNSSSNSTENREGQEEAGEAAEASEDDGKQPDTTGGEGRRRRRPGRNDKRGEGKK